MSSDATPVRRGNHVIRADLAPTDLQGPPTESELPVGERPGDVIGPYHLLELVGEGGFGVVYVAEQRTPVRRRVALKIVKAGMDTKEVIARFEAERQALAMMDHPNVAKIFEAGVTDRGRPYFAMEHVPGLPITQYCDTSKLRTRDRLELFIQICQAVQHAHQKGIIHRDLKPSNILVTLFDSKPVPKVIDFGIAKATNAQLTQKTLYTESGRLMGTPEYMSPEQAETGGLDIDTRTDIYSLGVIMYELLTGTLPFDPKTLRQAGREGIARIIKEMEPSKPSTRLSTLMTDKAARGGASTPTDLAKTHGADIKSLASELRGDLDWITLKAMEKDRARRYETANALAMDVRRFLKGEMVMARPPSLGYRISKMARRHKAAFAVGLLIFAALALGMITASIGWIEARAANASLKVALEETKAARKGEAEKRIEAEQARATAEEQRAAAEEQRIGAEKARAEAEFNAYVATLVAAQADLKQFDTGAAAKRLDGAPEHLRDWEWKYLRAECDTTVGTALSYGETGAFYQSSLSPDGTLVSSWPLPTTAPDPKAPGADVTVRDVKTGQVVRVLPYANVQLFRTKFSPDNRLLFAYEQVGRASRLWDLKTGQQLLPEKLQNGTAFLGFDTTSKLVAVAFRRGYAGDGLATVTEATKVLRVDTWEEVCTLQDPNGSTWSQNAEFSADGRWIALCQGSNSPFSIFDAATGALVKQLDTGWAYCAAFSKDGKLVAAAFTDRNRYLPRVWETTTWTEPAPIKSEVVEFINAMAFVDMDGWPVLLTAGNRGAARFWSLGNGTEFAARRGPTGAQGAVEAINSIAVTPDRWLLATTQSGTVRRWDLTRPGFAYVAGSVALVPSPDGSMVAVGAQGTITVPDTVYLRRLPDLADVGRLCCYPSELGYSHYANGLDFSPDGRTLLAIHGTFGREPVKLKTYDVASKRWETPPGARVEPVHKGRVGWARYSPDGRFYATASDDKTVRLWSTQTSQRVAELAGHDAPVLEVIFSPDSRLLASCSSDKTVRLWSVETFTLLRTLTGHTKDAQSVVFTPDGKHLVSSSADGTVRLWDVASGAFERTIAELSASVPRLVISPSGTRMAGSVADGTVRLWDTGSWREVASLRPPYGVSDIRFVPDGYSLLLLYNGAVEQLSAVPESEMSVRRRALYDADRQAGIILDRFATPGTESQKVRERVSADASIPEPVRRAAMQSLDRSDGLTMKDRYTVGDGVAQAIVARVMLARAEPTVRGAWDPSAAKAQMIQDLRADAEIGTVELEAALDSVEARIASMTARDKDFPLTDSNPAVWEVVRWRERPMRLYRSGLRLAQAQAEHLDAAKDPAGILTTLGVSQLRAGDANAAVQTLRRAVELQATRQPTSVRADIVPFLVVAECAAGEKERGALRLEDLLRTFSGPDDEVTGGYISEAALAVGGAAGLKDAVDRLIARAGKDASIVFGALYNGIAYLQAAALWDDARTVTEGYAAHVKANAPTVAGYKAQVAGLRSRVLVEAGRFEEAEPLAREALRLRLTTTSAGAASAVVGGTQTSLGVILERQKKYTEAEPLLRAGLRSTIMFSTSNAAGIRRGIESLARVYEATGKSAEAAAWRARLPEFE